MIKTDRLDIETVSYEDVDDIFEYVSNTHTMRYERSEFKNKEDLRNMLKYFVDNKNAYVLREKGKQKVFGQVTLTPTNPVFNNEYNLGYIIHEDYQGYGYCTEACKAILEYGFNTLKVHRIRAACNPENISSWKVMEKLNMTREAHFKNRVCFKYDDLGNPIYTDEYVYALNIEDFHKD